MNFSHRGFSLIELIVVIAVIAAIALVVVPGISNFMEEAKTSSESRSIHLWNSIYQQVLAANPDFPHTTWETASQALANGYTTNIGNLEVTYQASLPDFINPGDPTFVAGTGITAAPAP
jgi:prepilin-type N-terminal cleavage/methylation domain-containing protein